MWTYVLRRLLIMVPTLFGVTVVSFGIMQLAPGDPLLTQLGSGGAAGQSSQTREAFLIQKRDLKLDKPLFLNFNYYRNYTQQVRVAAHYLSLPPDELRREVPLLAETFTGDASDPDLRQRLDVLRGVVRSIGVKDFDRILADPRQRARLERAIPGYVQVFCEDSGAYAASAALSLLAPDKLSLLAPDKLSLLESDEVEPRLKIGAIKALNHMVTDSFVYTYSRQPSDAETPNVIATWKAWWSTAKNDYPDLDADRRREVQDAVARLAQERSKQKMFDLLDEEFFDGDVPYFAEILLGKSTLQEKVVAAIGLTKKVGRPLSMDVSFKASPQQIAAVAENWRLFFELHRDRFQPAPAAKAWSVVADTQYAHMVWRLATFNFGRSAVRTREPVSGKLWTAAKVSAPLMLLAEIVIYLIAVPAGVICAVNRAGVIDRLLSLLLYLLYSMPPFVAAMLLLVFLCYGDYLKLFPMERLHSEGAEAFGFGRYLLDYAWHAVLPVLCLSLFSLAGMAMYARGSMLDVIGQDYIRTARAKGLSSGKVVMKHALRNSLIPIITLFSAFLPALLGGSVLIEQLFNIPGMGRMYFDSILQKDFPTLMALLYLDAIIVMLSILLTDLLYVVVDPRISFESKGSAA